MKLWKKICLKGIVFALIFLTLLSGVQEVLRYKGENAEDMGARYESLRAQVEAGMEIDVLYLGSSPIYAAVSPMVMWEKYGYTGMNLGTSTQNVMSLYYSLLDVLEYTQPRVIVMGFRDLTETRMADDMECYYSYRKAIDTIQSPRVKWQLLADVVKTTGSLEHIFTISRFHERWDSLTAEDFDHGEVYYRPYTRGALMNEALMEVTLEGVYDETVVPAQYSAFSLEYYQKILSLCEERNIQIVGLTPPTVKIGEHMAYCMAVSRFCSENNIPCLDFNDPELQTQMNLDFSTDFYDREHLNVSGSLKLSAYLADRLAEICDLPDHREDPVYASWNDDLAVFREKYMGQA